MKTKTKTPAAPETSGEAQPATTAASSDAAVVSRPPAPAIETVKIALARLVPSPTNPRKKFNAEKQAELEASMRANGFSLSTLLVRPIAEEFVCEPHQDGASWCVLRKLGASAFEAVCEYDSEAKARAELERLRGRYEVVAGERRLRAALAVGVVEAPCIVRAMTDEEVLRFQLIENIQRDDLTAIEEAQGFRRLLLLRDEAGAPMHTTATLATATGKSVRHIERSVKLCVFSEDPALAEFAKALDEGFVSAMHGRLVARLADPKQRAMFAKEILAPKYEEAPLSKRQAEQLLQRDYMVDTRSATFDLDDETVVPVELDELGARLAGGKCRDCPHLFANAKHLMESAPEGRGGVDSMCLNPSCFGRKQAAEWAQWQERNTDPAKKRRALDQGECRKFYQYGDQLVWGCGHVDLAQHPDTNDLKPGAKSPGTWRSLVKGSEIEVVVVRDRNGKQHELVSRELAITAAIESGEKCFKVPAKGGSASTAARGGEGAGELPIGALSTEARDKLAKAAQADFEREQMQDEIERRLGRELAGEIAGKAAKPPAGWWLFVLRHWEEIYVDDVIAELCERRGWKRDDADAQLVKLTDAQNFGVFVEVAFLCVAQTPRSRKELLEMFAVDEREVEKRVREVVKVERAAKAAEEELRDSMVWQSLGEREDAAKPGDFEFNEHSVCVDPMKCVIRLPKIAKKARCEVSVARSVKGWHVGIDVSTGGSPMPVAGRGSPVKKVDAAYSSRTLALRTGLLEVREFFKSSKAPAAVLEHLSALVKLVETEAPATAVKKNGKGSKK
ncbi:MAG: ParB/RepB/Spo0J family partition protein [Chthoniobacteraceae bacterium]